MGTRKSLQREQVHQWVGLPFALREAVACHGSGVGWSRTRVATMAGLPCVPGVLPCLPADNGCQGLPRDGNFQGGSG